MRQKDKDGHFTGHWLLLPADQPHGEILPLHLCGRFSDAALSCNHGNVVVVPISQATKFNIEPMSRYIY